MKDAPVINASNSREKGLLGSLTLTTPPKGKPLEGDGRQSEATPPGAGLRVMMLKGVKPPRASGRVVGLVEMIAKYRAGKEQTSQMMIAKYRAGK